jgi:hypothetical protein
VDCRDVEQYAGDAIDRSLAKEVENEFQAHLERCSPCRKEIVLEKLSKQMVRQNVRWIPTPRSIHSLVVSTLHREQEYNGTEPEAWLAGIVPSRVVLPALAGGIVAAVFFLMVSTQMDISYRQTAHTASNDIINQSFKNLALLQAGKFQPAMVSTVAESVSDFFQRSDLQFGVEMPKFHNCDWCGGSASERSGVKQAHLIYRIGNEWVFVFEVSDDDGLYGTQLSLPPAAKRALAQSGWYTDPDHPDCNVIIWKTDEAVCVAVSTMNKGKLLALLTAP